MAHYSEQIENDHFVTRSDTPEADKDSWKTPPSLFNGLDNEFRFDVDICASAGNSLCVDFLSKERSALTYEWNHYYRSSSCFVNPPYSQTQLFLNRSAEQAKKHNITVVALVNANTDTKWFAECADSANEIRLITGRVGFVRNDGAKANGNTKGQCLIIWRGNSKTPCNIVMVDRDDLEGSK